VELELAETVSTRTIKRGDTFALKLAAPLIVDGRVLIPAGVAGVGQVVDAGKPGLGGRPAKLVLAARRLEFDGREAPLRGFFLGGTGADNTEATAVTVALVGIAGFLIQGGHVEIPAGTRARAKLAQDFTSSQPPAPTPLVQNSSAERGSYD
jgi:hypothetical protein